MRISSQAVVCHVVKECFLVESAVKAKLIAL